MCSGHVLAEHQTIRVSRSVTKPEALLQFLFFRFTEQPRIFAKQKKLRFREATKILDRFNLPIFRKSLHARSVKGDQMVPSNVVLKDVSCTYPSHNNCRTVRLCVETRNSLSQETPPILINDFVEMFSKIVSHLRHQRSVDLYSV